MGTIIKRRATIYDLNEVARLFDLYRVFYKKQSDIDGARDFIKARMEMDESVVFVAEDTENKMLVGFTQLYPIFSSTRMQRLWLLNDLYVMEDYRGRGVSKHLIDCAKTHAKETEACGLLLETAKTNDIGNRLYPAVGFDLEDASNFYFWTNK